MCRAHPSVSESVPRPLHSYSPRAPILRDPDRHAHRSVDVVHRYGRSRWIDLDLPFLRQTLASRLGWTRRVPRLAPRPVHTHTARCGQDGHRPGCAGSPSSTPSGAGYSARRSRTRIGRRRDFQGPAPDPRAPAAPAGSVRFRVSQQLNRPHRQGGLLQIDQDGIVEPDRLDHRDVLLQPHVQSAAGSDWEPTASGPLR